MKTYLSLALLMVSSAFANAQNPLTRNPDFGTNGLITLPLAANSASERGDVITVQPDGKLLVAYHIKDETKAVTLGLLRLNPDGSFDESFDFDGRRSFDLSDNSEQINDMAVLDNGNIVCVGFHETETEGLNGFVIMVNNKGALVTDFADNGILSLDQSVGDDDVFLSVAALGSNKFIVGGTILAGGKRYFSIQQFLNNGSFDPNFNNGTFRFTQIGTEESTVLLNDMAVGSDGRTALCGQVRMTPQSEMEGIVVSFTNSGSLNFGFGDKGQLTVRAGQDIPTALTSLVYNDDNSLMLVGSANFKGEYKTTVVRLLENGVFDNNFQTSGIGQIDVATKTVEVPQSIDIIANGIYLVTGSTLSEGLDDMCFFIDANGDLYTEYEGVKEGFKVESFSDDAESWAGSVVANGFVYRVGYTELNEVQRVMLSSRSVPEPVANNIPHADLVGAVYPNPVSDQLTVSLTETPTSPVTVSLMDVTGRVVYSNVYSSQQFGLSLVNLETGYYQMLVVTENTFTTQMVVKR